MYLSVTVRLRVSVCLLCVRVCICVSVYRFLGGCVLVYPCLCPSPRVRVCRWLCACPSMSVGLSVCLYVSICVPGLKLCLHICLCVCANLPVSFWFSVCLPACLPACPPPPSLSLSVGVWVYDAKTNCSVVSLASSWE